MKTQRQKAILHLVRSRDIYTQAELITALADMGFPTAQATISRDIRELRLAKEQTVQGQRYAAPLQQNETSHHLVRIFRDGLLDINYACNTVVLTTVSGLASAVALALDEMNLPEVLGTIAGENCVICVVKTEPLAAALVEKLTL